MSENPLGGLPADEVNELDDRSLPAQPFTVDEGRADVALGDVVLSVKDLKVEFPTDDGVVKAVDGVSFDVREAETLGIVGESGSGKSVTSMSILGLLPKSANISGSINFRGTELLDLEREAAARSARREDRDDLPGRARRAEPGVHGGGPDRGGDRGPRREDRQAASCATASSSCSTSSGSRRRASASTSTRTSTPAVCGSGR